jgi:hypothetical protein
MILWYMCPMRELLKRRKLETRLRNSSDQCFTLPSPCFPFPRFAPHRTLLGYAVNTGLHDSTQRCVLPQVRFRVYRRDWRQFSVTVRNKEFMLVCNQIQSSVCSQLSKWVIEELLAWVVKSASVKRRLMCNIWSALKRWFLCLTEFPGED